MTHTRGHLVGSSEPFQKVNELISKAASADLPVLIVGETGTGKELVACEIHARSQRASKPFIAVNTGALPREIVVSELFGHRRGSFTGATSDRLGRFREADGGTLFLDEIGTMDATVQVSLLRVLENETFRPVGASEDEEVDVRLIAATNEDPRALAQRGEFREDLLYRFEVLRIDLPPLREIRDDIPQLVEHFVQTFSEMYQADIDSVSPAVLDALVSYHWPGNTRELKNVIAQACVVAERGTLQLEHLPARWQSVDGTPASVAIPKADHNAPAGLASDANAKPSEQGFNPQATPTPVVAPMANGGVVVPLGITLDEVQKTYILRTLEACNNNKTRAAKALGVSRKTLYDRLDRWGCR